VEAVQSEYEESISSSIPSLSPSPTSSTSREDCNPINGLKLNQSLQALKVTPVRPSDAKKRHRLASKIRKARRTLRQQVKNFAGRPITPSSKKTNCSYCCELLKQLSSKFPSLKSKSDKYKALTSVPKRFSAREIRNRFCATSYQVRHAVTLRNTEGHFSWPMQKSSNKPLTEEVLTAVKNFYFAEENSRPSSVARDTVYVAIEEGKREKHAKYRLIWNLNDLYSSFKAHHKEIKISVSKFSELRPKNCAWPGRKGYHITCVCLIHQKFLFMLEGLGIEVTTKDFLSSVICKEPTHDCYLGLCDSCPNKEYINSCFEAKIDEDEIEYLSWQHTDYTDIKKITTSMEAFTQEFEAYIPKILIHDFIYKQQRDFIERLRVEYLKTANAITVLVDYPQNYTFIIQKAVQVRNYEVIHEMKNYLACLVS